MCFVATTKHMVLAFVRTVALIHLSFHTTFPWMMKPDSVRIEKTPIRWRSGRKERHGTSPIRHAYQQQPNERTIVHCRRALPAEQTLAATMAAGGSLLIRATLRQRIHREKIMSMAAAVTTATFDQEVLKSEVPVLVDFWAEWCGPCKMIAPHLDRIAEDYGDKIRIRKVDIEEERGLAEKY